MSADLTRRGTIGVAFAGVAAGLLPSDAASGQAVITAGDPAPGGITPTFADPRDALQRAFAAILAPGARHPTVRLSAGAASTGAAPAVLNSVRASLLGEGISVSYLHATGPAGEPALTLRNAGGRTADFAIDSGPPGGDEAAGRRVPRHGILFDWHGGHGTVRSIEARWFNGYGLRFADVWDSLIENVIAVGCGNAEHYAIEIVSARDVTNHTNIARLQAERSVGGAILIDARCLNLVVDGIHCEGTVGTPGRYALQLLGNSMSYRNARVANDGGNVTALLGGGGNVYDRMAFEAGTRVDYATAVGGPAHASTITSSSFDTLRIPATNTGHLVIRDSTIARLEIADQARTVRLVRCQIGDVACAGNSTDVTLDDCTVTGTWSRAGNPTLRARHCRFEHGPTLAQLWLDGCAIARDFRSGFNQLVRARDCWFGGGVILDSNGARVWLSGDWYVAGDLGYDAGAAFGACGDGGRCEGRVHPNWYGTGGTWPRGTVRHRPDAGRGDAPFTRFDGRGWSAAAPLT